MLDHMTRQCLYGSTLALTVLTGASCGDAVAPRTETDLRIASVRLLLGTAAQTFADGQTAAVFEVPAGTININTRAEWLDASGNVLRGASPSVLELQITSKGSTSGTFTLARGTFSGTFRQLRPGSNVFRVAAWDQHEGSTRFTLDLNIVVREYDCPSSGGCWDY